VYGGVCLHRSQSSPYKQLSRISISVEIVERINSIGLVSHMGVFRLYKEPFGRSSIYTI